jgi:hypothetical protein
MFQLGDRVAFRGSKLGEDYLVLGWVIGSAAETARLAVVWDFGGYDTLPADEVVAAPGTGRPEPGSSHPDSPVRRLKSARLRADICGDRGRPRGRRGQMMMTWRQSGGPCALTARRAPTGPRGPPLGVSR